MIDIENFKKNTPFRGILLEYIERLIKSYRGNKSHQFYSGFGLFQELMKQKSW
jgi:hypothetical protein